MFDPGVYVDDWKNQSEDAIGFILKYAALLVGAALCVIGIGFVRNPAISLWQVDVFDTFEFLLILFFRGALFVGCCVFGLLMTPCAMAFAGTVELTGRKGFPRPAPNQILGTRFLIGALLIVMAGTLPVAAGQSFF